MTRFQAFIFFPLLLIQVESVFAKIVNHVVDPCINEVVQAAVYGPKSNEINQLIRNFFNVNDSVNLTIDQVHDFEPAIDAITTGFYNSHGVLNIEISFNGRTMPGASQEYILVTLYHEFLHAILLRKGVQSAQQHESIAAGYRKALSRILLQHFPHLLPDDARALVWGGLQDTVSWNNLSFTVRQSITRTNMAYKTRQMGSICD